MFEKDSIARLVIDPANVRLAVRRHPSLACSSTSQRTHPRVSSINPTRKRQISRNIIRIDRLLARLKPLFSVRRPSPHATSTRIPTRTKRNEKKLEFQPTFTTLGDDRRGENNLRTRVKSIKISHPMSRSSRILPAGVCVCVTVLNSKKITDGCAYHVETKPRVTKRIILNPTRRLPSLYTRRVRVCGSTHSRTDGWMDDLCINCFYRDILWWRPKSV